jgi:hypothetical protein
VDHPFRQARWPSGSQPAQVAVDRRREAGLQRFGRAAQRFEHPGPGGAAEIVGAAAREAGAGRVQPGEPRARLAAMGRARAAHREPAQEGDDRRRLAAQGAQQPARAVADGRRARKPAPGQVLHEAEKERQVVRPHLPLVDGEDIAVAVGLEQEVGVLHPLGDALERERHADVVAGQEGLQFGVADVGVDRHARPAAARRGAPDRPGWQG